MRPLSLISTIVLVGVSGLLLTKSSRPGMNVEEKSYAAENAGFPTENHLVDYWNSGSEKEETAGWKWRCSGHKQAGNCHLRPSSSPRDGRIVKRARCRYEQVIAQLGKLAVGASA
jgi:hypothetical protein